MRKRVLVMMFMLLFGTACKQAEAYTAEEIQETREFDFYNSIIFENGDTKEVYMNAIINVENYDLESMFEEVKEEYYLMNGNADKLTLRLYKNVDSLKAGDSLGEKVYTD